MACINSINTNLCCSLHTGWTKTRPTQKLLVRVKFTGNLYSYRTRISVNGHHWNTCKLVFLGTPVYGYSDSHSCLCECTLTLSASSAHVFCMISALKQLVKKVAAVGSDKAHHLYNSLLTLWVISRLMRVNVLELIFFKSYISVKCKCLTRCDVINYDDVISATNSLVFVENVRFYWYIQCEFFLV